jgi:pimeloyl-ACP methyl ester carboxylesterase
MSDLIGSVTDMADYAGPTPCAQAWFAGGERVGYDPKARAIVASQGAPLEVFLRREGDLDHAVSFLPGFPDGSFGWAKVLPHLPNAAAMTKLFVEYVGMGDSDKPKDYAYSTAVAELPNSDAASRRRGESQFAIILTIIGNIVMCFQMLEDSFNVSKVART